MRAGSYLRRFLVAAAAIVLGATLMVTSAGADMMDMTGIEPWEVCGGCHGLDGAGNHIKFPRIAGQRPDYIVKQLEDFRGERRHNDGGQMQMMASELKEPDIARVAKWFAAQRPAWPKATLPAQAGDRGSRRNPGLSLLPQCRLTGIGRTGDHSAAAGRTARLLHRQATRRFPRRP